MRFAAFSSLAEGEPTRRFSFCAASGNRLLRAKQWHRRELLRVCTLNRCRVSREARVPVLRRWLVCFVLQETEGGGD